MTNYDNYVNLLLRPDLIQEIDRELATRSLRAFIEQAWPVLQPATPFVPGWHIDALCEHLEAITYGQIRNLVINIPPRHMKSLAVSVFWPCWEMDALARAALAVRQLRREPQLARFAPLPNRGPVAVVPAELGRRFRAHRGPERKAAFR